MNKKTHSLFRFKYTLLFIIFLFTIIAFQAKSTVNIVTIFSVISIAVIIKILSSFNKYISFVLLFILASVIALQGVYSFSYGNQVGYSEIEVIALTNTNEANGMMRENIVSILFSVFVSFFLVFMSKRELSKVEVSFKKYLIFFASFFIVTGAFLGYKLYEDKDFHAHDIPRSSSFFLYYFLRTTCPIVYTPTYSVFLYYKDVKRFERLSNLPKNLEEGMTYNDTISNPPKRIFIILGESLTRRNMSLYGYKVQNTTPFLNSLTQDSILHYYTAISAANFTNRAIPLAITSSSIDSLNDYFTIKTSIELAKDRGVMTYWFSNQPKTDMFNTQSLGNAPTNIGSAADYSYFASNEIHLDDFDLIQNYLKEKNKNPIASDKSELVFFHMRGSHQPYSDGCDENDILEKAPNLKQYETDYNMTVRHTDRFMEQLFNIINKDSDLIIMISDHGEEVGFGHFSQYLLKTQYDVPYLIINNNDRDYVDFLNEFVADDGIISTSSLYYLIAHTLGYQIDRSLIDKVKENTYTVLNSGLISDYRSFE